MTFPLITGYTAVFLALLQIVLMMAVGVRRRAAGITLGDGGDEALLYGIRRHGNLIENAPIFIILLAFYEAIGGVNGVVISLAAIFAIARLSHAYALSGPDKPIAPRAIGAMGTLASILGAAAMVAYQLFAMQQSTAMY